jgi:hypothetical protein
MPRCCTRCRTLQYPNRFAGCSLIEGNPSCCCTYQMPLFERSDLSSTTNNIQAVSKYQGRTSIRECRLRIRKPHVCGTFTVSHASSERIGIRKVTRAENLHLLLLTYCSLSCRNPCECVKPKSSFISGQGYGLLWAIRRATALGAAGSGCGSERSTKIPGRIIREMKSERDHTRRTDRRRRQRRVQRRWVRSYT